MWGLPGMRRWERWSQPNCLRELKKQSQVKQGPKTGENGDQSRRCLHVPENWDRELKN